ncbi:hypothetical protein FKN01_24965 [Streptomyces sp. 130]|nr:hypothetical protein FKN01_24965 [Streptomyces sp. 130]
MDMTQPSPQVVLDNVPLFARWRRGAAAFLIAAREANPRIRVVLLPVIPNCPTTTGGRAPASTSWAGGRTGPATRTSTRATPSPTGPRSTTPASRSAAPSTGRTRPPSTVV